MQEEEENKKSTESRREYSPLEILIWRLFLRPLRIVIFIVIRIVRRLKNWGQRIHSQLRDRVTTYRPLAPDKMHDPTDLALVEEQFFSLLEQQNLIDSSEDLSSLVSRVPEYPKRLPGSLWCITSYFNPNGGRIRRDIYKTFARELRNQGGKLLTVELPFGEREFELSEADADVLIQLRGGSFLWQHERLLNIALDNLPHDCDKVAWVDADIVFNDARWLETTAQLLEKYRVLQPFSFRLSLGKDCSSLDLTRLFPLPKGCCIEPSYLLAYLKLDGKKYRPDNQFARPNHGSVWAARRDILDSVRFYDRLVMGGGDSVMLHAFLGDGQGDFALNKLSKPLLKDIGSYSQLVDSLVEGSVYYQDELIIHLWHGNLYNREYVKRQEILCEHEFDPEADIQVSETGTWEWASDKEELHSAVKDYFELRKEEAKV